MCWPHQMFHRAMIQLLCTLPAIQCLNRIFEFLAEIPAESKSDVNSMEAVNTHKMNRNNNNKRMNLFVAFFSKFFVCSQMAKKMERKELTVLAIWMSEPIWQRSQISGLFSNRTSLIFCNIIAWLSSMPFNWFRDISNSCARAGETNKNGFGKKKWTQTSREIKMMNEHFIAAAAAAAGAAGFTYLETVNWM